MAETGAPDKGLCTPPVYPINRYPATNGSPFQMISLHR